MYAFLVTLKSSAAATWQQNANYGTPSRHCTRNAIENLALQA
jgi:hypothetical protein